MILQGHINKASSASPLPQRIIAVCLSVLLVLQGFGYTTPAYAAGSTSSDVAAQSESAGEASSSGDSSDSSSSSSSADSSDSADEGSGSGDSASSNTSSSTGNTSTNSSGNASSSEANDTSATSSQDGNSNDAIPMAAASNDTTGTYDYTTIAELNTALGSHGSATGEGASAVITFNDNDALKLITHADPTIYKNATIQRGGSTGSGFSVCSSAGEAAAFQGFGSNDSPFAGKLVDSDGTSAIEIATDRTFFNALALTSDNGAVKIVWKGATNYGDPMIAAELSGEGTLDTTVSIADPTDTEGISEDSAALTAPLVGTSTATATVKAAYSFSETRKALNVSASSNIGLLANEVKSGKFTIGSVTGLDSASGDGSISTSIGNAGLFIGQLDDSAAVSMGQYTLEKNVTVKSESGCAGGLAGLVGSSAGATVSLTGAVDFTNLTAQGTTSSGGLIGKAVKLSLNQDSGATFTCPTNVGSTSSENTGGFIGSVSFADVKTFTGNNEVVTANAVQLKGKTNAGAVIGYHDIANGNVIFKGAADGTTTFKSALAENGGSVVYGGIVGRVEDTSAKQIDSYYASIHTVTMNNVRVEGTCTKRAKTAGGLVGSLGSSNTMCATLIVDNATAAWDGPWVSQSFGGVVGCVDNYSVLDCGAVTVSTKTAVSNGAGIVGESWKGTIRLHGTTDLSGLNLSGDAGGYVGQIAVTSAANPSLIFAQGTGSNDGWTFKRPAAVAVDDLGGASGGGSMLGNNEVVRLGSGKLSSGLITLDSTTHQPRFWLSENSANVAAEAFDSNGYSWGRQLKYDSSSKTVSVVSVDEFACLALTIQTRGYFSGVSGIGFGSTVNNLGSATINITNDIDLTGTGITGLTQDVYTTNFSWEFKGTLNGNDKTVTLAVGEPYGMRGDAKIESNDTTEGNGKIYYHNRLGLFGEDGGSTVNNLKLAGTIRAKSDGEMAIGAYAAEKCLTGSTTFSGLAVSTALVLEQNDDKKMFAGNVYGTVEDSGSITFASDCSVTSNLTSNSKPNGDTRIGGVIGFVDSGSTATINVNALSVSGLMGVNGNVADNLGVGGFIAGIKKGTTKTVNITSLALSGLSLTYSGVKKTCGGFLGYSWANTDVTFKSSSSSAYALTTNNAKLSVAETGNNAFSLGGLVYRASGVWDVGEYAVNLGGATLTGSNIKSGSNLGLLVCVGGDDGNLNGSLYLKNTAYWGEAYKVDGLTLTGMDNFSNFDEWVYNTCANGKGIADCGTNGVVSLHTDDETLDMEGTTGSRNSYVNRTSLGTSYKTNGKSRYYYNLDRAVSSASTNNQIDTPYELLLWSVSRYADDNLKSEFAVGDAGVTGPTITGDLDMTGYSYYPVDVTGESVTVSSATITFCNEMIEAEEAGNKLTSAQTQHMNMHAGLLRNFYAGTDSSVAYTVSDVTLKGSVGMDVKSNTAGALLSGTMAGTQANARVATLDINRLTLDGLAVHGVSDTTTLAPLVACNMGTYTALNVNGITASNYTSTTTAATSLFGNLGGENADQVTASFINVAVSSLNSGDDKNAIFTHASLLESYSYAQNGSSSATYTFVKADQENSNVTFGSEIDSNGEYSGKQLWYYDESTYETDNGLVNDGTRKANKDNPQYGVYLPYVAKGKDGTAYHEIKVNQRISNLTAGCGTYGDPYAITTPGQLYAVANYLNTRAAQDGWVVTITKDQETVCTRRNDASTDNEVTYQYSGADSKWHKGTYSDGAWISADDGATLDNDTMHRYIQSCYLSIETSTLTVDSSAFNGLGTHDYPFRGVIVGNLTGSSNATLQIDNSSNASIQGLITYSYGSVVRDLGVQYAGETNTIAYSAKNAEDGVPTSFFGGVIGCIMGGDNIIDGVNVSASNSVAATTSLTLDDLAAMFTALASGDSSAVSATGDKSHLVPIGGYVGAIAGGGVIFRNMSGSSWHESGSSLYDNSYVGRVIDGFAFSEGCTVDNGDDNYKINKLDTSLTDCVTTTDIQGKYREESTNTAATVTVNNAQGLLVLSAIINSGAAAGPSNSAWDPGSGIFCGSRAYQGCTEQDPSLEGYRFGNKQFGKVRNASYGNVGGGVANDDFDTSKHDDRYAPGKENVWEGPLDGLDSTRTFNSPYLVSAYANAQTGYVCASKLSGVSLQFASGGEYAMSDYGTGFTGLSGRYYSNACYAGKKNTDRDRIIPWIACINGNNATLTLDSAVKEYQDDDYSVAGVGGLFSTIVFTSNQYVEGSIASNQASVKDITFKNCTVSLTYLDSNNKSVSNYAKSNTGAGILAGVTANANSQESYGVYKNVTITADSGKTTTVSGGENVGGLIGSAGYAQRSGSDSVDEIVSFSGLTAPIKLYDCSYSKLLVTGRSNAGGFVGKIASGESGVWATDTSDLALASSSTIAIDSSSTDYSNAAGGVFGLVGCSVNVNTGQDASATQLAVMSDVKVTTECAANGGDNGCSRGVGSLVGRAEGAATINRFEVTASVEASSGNPVYLGSLDEKQNASTGTAAKNIGGIIGWSNRDVTVNNSAVEKLRLGAGEHSGGIVGTLNSGVTLTVDGSTVNALKLDGARMGGVVGNVDNSGATVNVLNSKIQNCAFSGTASYWIKHPGGNGNFSGGIVGYALGTYKIANVLLGENTFADTAKRQGLLVGCTAESSSNFKGLYAAGIDVKLASGQANSDVPGAICYFMESSDKAAINQKSYIAFADYTDDFGGTSGLYGATGVSPYVTTSPKSGVSVKADTDGDAQDLFGDGAAITTAATIKDEAGTSQAGRYAYTNIGGIGSDGAYRNTNDYDSTTSASTFNANNSDVSKQVTDNFPVLLLPGNDTTTVTNYLNLVTNGGFSDAVRLNGSTTHVSATVQTVKLENGSLVASTDTPTVRVVNNGTSSMSFRASSNWDNEKGQFSLLTVTFSEAGQTYNVQVPIIVKRMLEIDFTATYSYGTHFTPSDYANLGRDAHVLSNFGEPMTGYLTWTYNQAKGQATEYGWDTHLASGGSMRALGKSIDFSGSGTSGSLPAGTQLTLVDTAHGDKAYHYTVGEGGASSVKLMNFRDSQGNAYSEQWLSELMGVSAKADNSGAWVECNASDSNVGAKVVTGSDTKYYRAYTEGDTGDRCTLTVAKGSDGKETSPSESFYLVVNVPNSSTITTAVNGYTSASFDDTSINKNLTCTLRKDNTLDNHQNSASTYSIYSSYTQTLVDSTGKAATSEQLTKTEDGTGYTFPLAATDTIAFDSAQQYNDSDKLYYQFGASLVSYVKSGDTASSSGASGFPTGTTGTLSFYVKVGETYYVPNGSGDSTRWSAAMGETAATTKSWSADGNDLNVSLSDESGNLYDLSGLRKIAASSGSIEIIAKVTDLKMSEEAAKQAIAASQDGTSYTKVHYRSALSTRTDTLSTSGMVASVAGDPGYYRKDSGTSTIELTASKQTQLGINVDDLELADGTIGAVGTYSLLNLVDGDSKINQAASVRYTLTLQQRASNGNYSSVNIGDYLSINSSDLGKGTVASDRSSITFADTKKDDAFATRDGSTNCFKFLFEVKVNTNVEAVQHTYANYRIVLKAQLLDSSGNVVDTPVNAIGAAGYDNSDYITYSLTRVNTNGITHESTN